MSSMARSMPRGASAASAEKRKKQILLIGGVILVALVLFQVMRLGGGSSAAPPKGVTTSGTYAAATATAAPTGAAVTFTTPPATRRALDRLPAKDPFVPLVREGTGSPEAAPAEASPPPQGDKGADPADPAAAPKGATAPRIDFTAREPIPKSAPLPPPTAAVISINGSSQTVGRSTLFPVKAPAFRLVAVGRTSIRVGVAGGSFTGGRPTITMRRGQRVTLVNTATGVRYVLRFAAPSTAPVEPATAPEAAEPPTEPAAKPDAEGDE
jgi:hypothetical protein